MACRGYLVVIATPFAVSDPFLNWLEALRKADVEAILLPVLVQLIVILLTARLFAVVFRWLHQPAVVGEIAAGLVLGPSVLKVCLPGVWETVFHPTVSGLPLDVSDQLFRWIFTALSQLGLVLLLFLVGLEFDFSHLRWHGKSALSISVAGVALPFLLGLGLAPVLLAHPQLHGADEVPARPLIFALFLGTALSITAIPVLGRIMLELNLTRTRVGAITIASAAADDAMGWVLLASVAALVRAQFDPMATLLRVVATLTFGLVMVFVARPILCRWVRHVLRRNNGEISLNALAVLMALIMLCSIITNLIGIFAIFGAFFLGAVLSGEHEFRQAVTRRLRDFVSVFFLPIFFTYTGLRTDVGSVGDPLMWLLCLLVIALAIIGKFAGCGLAAWANGFSLREASCVGAMMNTRGLMELIVVNLGYELGVIPRSVFCMLVLMALVTTVMTTPALLRLMRGTELEPYVLRSDFLSPRSNNAAPAEGDAEPRPKPESTPPAER